MMLRGRRGVTWQLLVIDTSTNLSVTRLPPGGRNPAISTTNIGVDMATNTRRNNAAQEIDRNNWRKCGKVIA
jgi:hypothetical protein